MENFILQYDTNPEKLLRKSIQDFSPNKSKDILQKFKDLVILPNIIKDREYLSRKKTFDTFLKKTDTEFFNMYLKYEKTGSQKTRRNLSSQNKGSDNFRIKTSGNETLLRNNQGKILSNEFWSENYYRSIMNSSYIREKFEKIVNEVKLRKFETKIKITDDFYRRKHQSFFQRQSIFKNFLGDEYGQNPNNSPFLKMIEENAKSKKNSVKSISEWMPNKQREFFSKAENLRENVGNLIKNCNDACSLNQELMK